MRLAVSGSHSTGKSSLIAAFLERRPEYDHEPEAYEVLGDDVPMTSGGPSLEGLETLLGYTVEVVASYEPGSRVVFERSPVDYIAYAVCSGAASGSISTDAFLETCVPVVRASVRNLDLTALLPVSRSGLVASRAGEDDGLRTRVDDRLRRAVVDDDYDLFGRDGSPVVVELSPEPRLQLAELIRRTAEVGDGERDGLG